MYRKAFCGQYIVDDVAPLYYGYCRLVLYDLGQFVGYNARFTQPVKIEVIHRACRRFIGTGNSEGRTSYPVCTPYPSHHSTCKGSFATAQIALQFYDFATTKIMPEPLGQLFGCL